MADLDEEFDPNDKSLYEDFSIEQAINSLQGRDDHRYDGYIETRLEELASLRASAAELVEVKKYIADHGIPYP